MKKSKNKKKISAQSLRNRTDHMNDRLYKVEELEEFKHSVKDNIFLMV